LSTMEEAQRIREVMKKKREKVNATLKELKLLISCKESGDFKPMLQTALYQKYGGEYCEYLTMLSN